MMKNDRQCLFNLLRLIFYFRKLFRAHLIVEERLTTKREREKKEKREREREKEKTKDKKRRDKA